MPIDLNAPLAWQQADADELKLLQCLQGNILKGHGREHTANIFFRFAANQPSASRRMLRELANFHLTSAHRQLLDAKRFKAGEAGGGPFVHLALSFSGYQAIGLEANAPDDPDFRAGRRSALSRNALNDPALGQWEAVFQDDIHAVVLAPHQSESEVAALTAAIKELIEDAGGHIVHTQHGRALKNAKGNGIEHFGYVDGRSQPLLLQEDIDREIDTAGSSRWDSAFSLNAALVQDPGPSDGVSFGSFFIFRKLEQDVRRFKTREQEVADALSLTGDDRELAGAMIVGRFEDGTPVTLSNTARGARPPNNFNYQGDPARRCPFHAHIRKANPRGSGGEEAATDERTHLMPRRGIPFEDVKRVIHPDELPEAGSLREFNEKVAPLLPSAGVGLLFMAYNQEIARQFKFTQQTWANNHNFPRQPGGPHGIDPVIGQGCSTPGEQELPTVWDDPGAGANNQVDFAGFVHMRGGEYFFHPALPS